MVRRCSDQFAKTLLVIFNLFFLICGISIVIISLTRSHPASFDQLVSGLKNVNYLFLGVGLFISLVSFLGCCGAWQESRCMLNLFLVLLVALLITEVSVGALAYVKRNKIEGAVKDQGIKLLKKNDSTAKEVFDDIQKTMKCCGINGPDDYMSNGIMTIPSTCCKDKPSTCDKAHAYSNGCYVTIVEKIKNNLLIVGNVAFVICIVEVIGIIFACCLRGGIAEKYETI